MITKEQLKILKVYYGNIFAELTFKQIKEKSGQKSNNIVQIALKEFIKQDLINTRLTGDVKTYYLNFNDDLALSYVNLINALEIKRRNFPKNILAQIKEVLFKQTKLFILIVFGSYAKNKANPKSDLDIAIIIDSEELKKEIIPLIETVKRRELKKIDYHIFTEKEFSEMLNSDYENIGKQICKNSFIYYGFIQYSDLMRRIK